MAEQKTILIVDDEEILLQLMSQILESPKRRLLLAKNGKEALKILNQQKVDCVISDLKMPVMDGLQLIKEVRQQGNQLPFIFYSGHGDKEVKLEVIKYGVFDFIDKPDFTHLEVIIDRALGLQVSSEDKFVSEYQKLIQESEKD